MVHGHHLFVAAFGQAELVFKAVSLIDGVVGFRVSVGYFLAVDEQLEAFNQAWFGAVKLW